MDFHRLSRDRSIVILIAAIVISLFLIFLRDGTLGVHTNLGIEFVGGVRIPVTLEHPVDSDTMSIMVDTIKLRINKLGLAQADVRPLGNSQIIVEIPQAGESAIANVESILREQGRFEAIIDGQQALNGSDILPNAVGGPGSEAVTQNPDGSYGWELGFAATRPGADKFGAAARGKANYPVYMFLDRPSGAAILLEHSWFNTTSAPTLVERALSDAVHKNGDDITIIWLDNVPSNFSRTLLANATRVIVDDQLATRRPQVYAHLIALGFGNATDNTTSKLTVHSLAELIAQTYASRQSSQIVNSWPAIGLLSGPVLDPGLASGYVSQFYRITGTGSGSTPQEQQAKAQDEIKVLKSVISGGRLPVSTVIGSSYSVSASLGKAFLTYSALGFLLAVAIVALIIIVRYRAPLLIVPILLISLSEVLITLAIVGTIGTLSLAAAAGIITLIGTGVDNQIIITDELLRKRGEAHEGEHEDAHEGMKEKLGRAFHIVFTTAAVAIVSMLPLANSGIVEIYGFALSTIFGILVGVLITRPAYGALVGELFGRHE